ncbi:MAG: hypothetical protein OXL33_04625, partial [Chloroflexota bacterium]|nr:hypothetical protein [Chloroflexota bacterium]
RILGLHVVVASDLGRVPIEFTFIYGLVEFLDPLDCSGPEWFSRIRSNVNSSPQDIFAIMSSEISPIGAGT